MRFTKKFPINLSPKYLAMLMLGGASLFASCDKEDEPARDVELVFLENSLENNLDPRLEWNEFIKLVADPKVNNIYSFGTIPYLWPWKLKIQTGCYPPS